MQPIFLLPNHVNLETPLEINYELSSLAFQNIYKPHFFNPMTVFHGYHISSCSTDVTRKTQGYCTCRTIFDNMFFFLHDFFAFIHLKFMVSSHTFEHLTLLSGLYSLLGLTPLTLAQSISPPGDVSL